MNHRLIAVALLSICFASRLLAQTDTDLTLGHWDEHSWGLTLHRPLYQAQSDVHGDGVRPRDTAQLFWWDSTGRFRFSTSNPNAPTIGYRYLTMTLDTNAPTLPDTLDEVSLAGGLHLGELAGGNFGVVLGAGYSGDNLFAEPDGIFGIGHLTWRRSIDEQHSFVLTLDYDGNRSFLPDVPLPGFAYESRGENLSYTFGYPTSGI